LLVVTSWLRHVRPSAWNESAAAGPIFVRILHGFVLKSVDCCKGTKITDALHEDLRTPVSTLIGSVAMVAVDSNR